MDNTEKNYTYYAFISYKHGDMKWGRWLQRQLERYRLPRELCREKQLPARLSPIFRDETDLTAGKPVHDNLLSKLACSKYLIVICSRRMQQHPEYIDYEIQQFLALGNPISHILPVIVDGEGVAADPANEAMPPSLLAMGDRRPLGITMNHRRKQDVILKLVASMLDLELHTLQTRDQIRRQQKTMALLSTGLCAALGLGALMTWQFLSVKRAHLQEQLVYTQSVYQEGNRYLAEEMAASVLNESPLILSGDIALQANHLHTAASIVPVTGTMTVLESVSSDSRIISCADGNAFFIMGDNRATRYDLEGRVTLEFMVRIPGYKLKAVSPDGRHALLSCAPTSVMPGSTLWLWDMEQEQAISCLTINSHYDMTQNRTAGVYDNLVDGAFSPDGTLVCAFNTNGYFTENPSLDVFSSETGELVASIPGRLLTNGPGNSNATTTVTAFEFISDTVLHWTGAVNHVYYDLETGQFSVVSLYDAAVAATTGIVLHGRYLCSAGNSVIKVSDLATGAHATLPAPGVTDLADSVYLCGMHVIVPAVKKTQDRTLLQDLVIVDLTTMTVSFHLLDDLPALSGKYSGWNVLPMESSGRIYLTLKGKTGLFSSIAPAECFCLDIRNRSADTLASQYIENLSEFAIPLHSGNETDWIMTADNGRALLLHIIPAEQDSTQMTAETYLLDVLYADASANYVFVGSSAAPRLISVRNSEYYLGSLESPGIQLDAGLAMGRQSFSLTDASSDGRSILKALRTTAALWQNSTLVWSVSLEGDACAAQLSQNGHLALIVCDHAAYLYDAATGTLLQRYEPSEDAKFLGGQLSEDGRLALLAEAPVNRVEESHFSLLRLPTDGSAAPHLLTDIAYYPPTGNTEHGYALSPDGRWAAVIEYHPVQEKYLRIISVYDPSSGTLLARTEIPGRRSAEPVLAPGTSATTAFDALTFGDEGTLMVTWASGVWLIDLEQMASRCIIQDSSQLSGLPLLHGDELLYPAGGLHVWDLDTLTLQHSVSLPASITQYFRLSGSDVQGFANSAGLIGVGEVTLSADGTLLAITGADRTILVNTGTWKIIGNIASSAVHVVYLDHSRFVYDTGFGLYEVTY